MSEREEVCGHCGCTGGAIVQKGDLPKKYHATYADCCDALRSQLAEVERERENVSSQLWDCTNERDGYKHRAERMERVVEAARPWIEDMWRGDLNGTVIGVCMEYEPDGQYVLWEQVAPIAEAVRALDAEAQP